MDHLLPPGLGPTKHISCGEELPNPFHPSPWPEPDIAFVIHAICVWQHHLQALSNRSRQVMRSVIKALHPLQMALKPHRCLAAQRVSASKNAAFVAFLTVLLRWPDTLQPQCLILGYPIVGLQRFLHVQPCGKHRVIDNAKKTLHNFNTSMMETITTVNVDFIATVIQQLLSSMGIQTLADLSQFPWLEFRVGTDDLPEAYRGLPVCTDHQNVSIVAIWQPSKGWSFMELFGLAYGLGSAVVAFNRFPQLGVAACRRCLYGISAAYFDDELSIECVRDADISQRSLQFIFTAMGAAPQPSKSFPPMANRHYLGTSVHVGSVAYDGQLRFQPKPATSQKVTATINHAIEHQCLPPDTAGKLRGDLNWMFSHCAGRIGKVAGPLLKRCQQGSTAALDASDIETLQLLRAVVSSARPRDLNLISEPRPLVRV